MKDEICDDEVFILNADLSSRMSQIRFMIEAIGRTYLPFFTWYKKRKMISLSLLRKP